MVIFPFEPMGRGTEKSQLDVVRGTLDVLILKALIWGSLHGYAITDLIRRQTDEALLIEEGTLYPALWRLESKGSGRGRVGPFRKQPQGEVLPLDSEGKAPAPGGHKDVGGLLGRCKQGTSRY